jgi:hypothetical protein
MDMRGCKLLYILDVYMLKASSAPPPEVAGSLALLESVVITALGSP